jgi:galactokinase
MEFEKEQVRMAFDAEIHSTFNSKFHSECQRFISPGRINLLGEHVDYNDGLVLPTAINKHILFAIAPNRSAQFNLVSVDNNESFSFDVDNLKPGHHWSSYFMGVIAGLRQRNLNVPGFDCVFGGDIPTGAGLSSSAALCCGMCYALNHIFVLGLEKAEMATLSQKAEHEFAGVNCGIMDQYACLFSEAGQVLLLDCRTMTHKTVPLEMGNYEFVLVNSMVSHQLASTEYNARRQTCERGLEIIKKSFPEVNSLRDVRLHQLNEIRAQMDEDTYMKCRYVISEVDRVIMATKFLNKKDMSSFGALMFQTHEGLSKEYEVSCAETDFLVDAARKFPGVAGARMMGGGFGGCTINILPKDQIDTFKHTVKEQYRHSFRKEAAFYQVEPSEGVHLLTSSSFKK